MTGKYKAEYFMGIAAGAESSAAVVAPLLIHLINPSSVLDVGCGTGAWLSAFHHHGVLDIVGVDGYASDAGVLTLAPSQFSHHDLSKPLRLGRSFDLAICLEVGEHLPSECAPILVESLCRHSSVVAFSAAIPHQGGVGHVNEQWQSYWASIFAHHAYQPLDAIRPKIWNDSRVESYYRQNLLIYRNIGEFPDSVGLDTRDSQIVLDVIHPASLTQPGIRCSATLLRQALRARLIAEIRKRRRA